MIRNIVTDMFYMRVRTHTHLTLSMKELIIARELIITEALCKEDSC